MNCPLIIIFMGVAGCGKSTVAALLARRTGAVFYEGDAFHPPANVEKMRAGTALTDEDRSAWLAALRRVIEGAIARKELAVLTCSALKAKYRQQLQGNDGAWVRWVYLEGSPELIGERLKSRRGHFMPATLLASQFAALEPPTEALVFSVEQTPEEIVTELLRKLEMEPKQ